MCGPCGLCNASLSKATVITIAVPRARRTEQLELATDPTPIEDARSSQGMDALRGQRVRRIPAMCSYPAICDSIEPSMASLAGPLRPTGRTV
jgi:hypothetical protein